MNIKKLWMTGVTAAALLPSIATAQQSTAPAPAGAAGNAQVAGENGLADIIVTANKQVSSLQKTSGAIATISGDALVALGVTNTQNLSKLVSGLQVEAGGSIYIRGVGSRVLSATGDPAVAFSVDGVYYGRPSGTSATLFDISRIEVVKGPQGTLYGRNATGGAVNLITNHPVIGARTLDGQIEAGNYRDIRTNVAANLPLGDNAALRLAGQTSYHRGYLSDGYDDDNLKSLRASVLFRPSPGVSFYLSGDYARQGGQGPGSVPVGPGSNRNVLTTRFVDPGNPWAGPTSPQVTAFIARTSPPTAIPTNRAGIYCAGIPFPPGAPVPANPAGRPALLSCSYPNGFPTTFPKGYQNNNFYGVNATMDADIGVGDLTAIGGYRGSRVRALVRGDPSFHTDDNRSNQYSGELRLASKPGSGRLKWIAGGFYLRENQAIVTTVSRDDTAVSNPIPAAGSPLPATTCVAPLSAFSCLAQATVIQSAFVVTSPDIVNETYAGFGQATFSVFDRLRLIGGIRYTHERKSETGGIVRNIFTLPANVVTSFPTQGSVAYHNVSYRAGLEFDIAPRSMFYAAYATAFHAGGFNLGVAQGPNVYQYEPEKVKYYVAGVKNRFFGNKLQMNIEVYWLDYLNYQQNAFGQINDGSVACSQLNLPFACPFGLKIINAAVGRIRGVEGDIVYAPTRNTTLNVNVLYNDARFLSFTATSQAGPLVYDGRRIPGTVPWTVTGGANQVFPLANGDRVIANVRSQYKASAYLWFTYLPAVYQKGYTRTDLNLTYETQGGHFTIGAFIRNLEDKATIVAGAPNDNITGAVYTVLNPPRTFGAILGFHF